MIELTGLVLKDSGQAKPGLALTFSVSHNVGALPTTLECNLDMVVAPGTGKVKASLLLEDLEADSVEAAREKMALWCDRMAAALRGVERMPFEVPLYERKEFNEESLAPWLKREFAVLSERFKQTLDPSCPDERGDVVQELIEQRHPLIFIRGALDQLLMFSYEPD